MYDGARAHQVKVVESLNDIKADGGDLVWVKFMFTFKLFSNAGWHQLSENDQLPMESGSNKLEEVGVTNSSFDYSMFISRINRCRL